MIFYQRVVGSNRLNLILKLKMSMKMSRYCDNYAATFTDICHTISMERVKNVKFLGSVVHSKVDKNNECSRSVLEFLNKLCPNTILQPEMRESMPASSLLFCQRPSLAIQTTA